MSNMAHSLRFCLGNSISKPARDLNGRGPHYSLRSARPGTNARKQFLLVHVCGAHHALDKTNMLHVGQNFPCPCVWGNALCYPCPQTIGLQQLSAPHSRRPARAAHMGVYGPTRAPPIVPSTIHPQSVIIWPSLLVPLLTITLYPHHPSPPNMGDLTELLFNIQNTQTATDTPNNNEIQCKKNINSFTNEKNMMTTIMMTGQLGAPWLKLGCSGQERPALVLGERREELLWASLCTVGMQRTFNSLVFRLMSQITKWLSHGFFGGG